MPKQSLPILHTATPPSVGFINLGCTKNQVDAEVMLGSLASHGFRFTTNPDSAEVDTINYGVDLGLRHGLTALLRELVQVQGLRWIRPFYLYPQQVDDELIALYA